MTTLELVFPRFILPQFNTHRVFSRNAASSRAIPVSKTITNVLDNPVIPIWNKNKPGMQGDMNVSSKEAEELLNIWLEARDDAVKHAKRLSDSKAHKQIANRILEPYMWTKAVLSSTELNNFFKLRIDDAAQPEIDLLANAIRDAMNASKPKELLPEEWHLPYVTEEEENTLSIELLLKISVARCARVSYKTFADNKFSTIEKDIELYANLLSEGHMSPFEHQARPLTMYTSLYERNTFEGNLHGFQQFRKLLGY